MREFDLRHGDCLEVLRGMETESVDAVVTDPPYGLSFMGKRWDYDVPSEEVWRECLRVLKPGGHLLAFAGTRTQHRMAVRIEDAGFEIRDMIAWVYGCLSDDSEVLTRDGWERYHTARHKEILAYDPEGDVYQWERPSRWSEYRVESDTAYRIRSDQTDQIVSRGHRCLVERGGVLAFIPADELAGVERVPYLQGDVSSLPQGRGELLLQAVLWQGEGLAEATFGERQGQEVSGQGDARGEEPGMEGRADVLQAKGQVRRPVDQVRSLPGGVRGHGPQGRLRHGASADCGDGDGAVAVAERVRASRQPRCDGQSAGEPDAVRVERGSQAARTRPSYRTTLAAVTPIEYTGLIFCPTVSTGAFVARRNGKVFVTGNSGFPKSLDVSKAIDRMDAAEEQEARRYRFTEWVVSRGVTAKQLNAVLPASDMGRHYTDVRPNGKQPAIMTREHLEACRHLLGDVPKWVERECDIRSVESRNMAEREVVGTKTSGIANKDERQRHTIGASQSVEVNITAPATDAARQWAGWGTALKPAMEPITVARKSLQGTVAENVLRYGTGGINVDGCRVGTDWSADPNRRGWQGGGTQFRYDQTHREVDGEKTSPNEAGRWPANLIHDGSDEVVGMFPQTTSGRLGVGHGAGNSFGVGNNDKKPRAIDAEYGGDSGSAARFYYCAKASKADRDEGCEGLEAIHRANGNKWTDQDYRVSNGERPPSAESGPRRNHHPTVKPTALMRYLCRLVTPPGGIVLDPFMGSGSTGKAAMLEGFRFIGIEREAEYIEIARARIAAVKVEPSQGNLFTGDSGADAK